jgi:hypothetical protein
MRAEMQAGFEQAATKQELNNLTNTVDAYAKKPV